MAAGDIYVNSAAIRANNTTHNIQPAGSEKLCITWATAGYFENYLRVTYSTSNTGNYSYPNAFDYSLGQHYQSGYALKPFEGGNGKLVMDNTHYMKFLGRNNSNYYITYVLSGIYLA